MPTHSEESSFWRDWAALTREQRKAFRKATKKLNSDLTAGGKFRPGLRVKGVQAHPGVFEMTWAPDGRATFHYGKPQCPGQTHVVWRRIGTHAILQTP